MAPRPPRTDRVVLSAILDCGKLNRAEQSAFQQMYDDINAGKVVDLTSRQRLWADSVYDKYNVSELRSARRRKLRAQEQKKLEPKAR